MKHKRAAPVLIFLFLLFHSCNKITQNSYIHDIWVGDYTITYYYTDSIGYYDYDAPLLIDFTENDSVFVKLQSGHEPRALWMPQDSVLLIDSIEYKLLTVNKDSLVYFRKWEIDDKDLKDYLSLIDTADDKDFIPLPKDSEVFVFKRIQKYSLPKNHSDFSIYLDSKLFRRNTESCPDYWMDEYLEFFENGAVISRNMDVEQGKIYFSNYSWLVYNYKENIFLIIYDDFYQNNLLNDYGVQLVDIKDSSFTLLPRPSVSRVKYHLETTSINKQTGIDLTGSWRSINDTTYYYKQPKGKRIEQPELISNGILEYNFTPDSVAVFFNELNLFKYKWRWNTDYSLLIFEQEEEFNDYKFTYIEYLIVESLKRDTIELKLHNPWIHKYIDNEHHGIVLKQFQSFVKVSQ